MALADVSKCIEVLARLEGNSGRQQLALALHTIHSGSAPRAEQILRSLIGQVGEQPEILRIAEVNLAFALLRQARYAEALLGDVESLRALYLRHGSELIRGWIENDLGMLGKEAGLDAERIEEMCRLPAPPREKSKDGS